MIVGLCDRFKKLPSEILNEDAEMLRLLQIYHRAHPQPTNPDEEVTDWDE